MKNLTKVVIAVISLFFLVSVFATLAHAQTFSRFVDSLSIVHGLPHGTESQNLALENTAYNDGKLVTLWERFKSFDSYKMSDFEFVYPPVEKTDVNYDIDIDILTNLVLPTKTDSLSEGDILMNVRYKKRHSDSLLNSVHHVYNYTKNWYVSTDLVDTYVITELCKKLLKQKYKKATSNFRYWVVGEHSKEVVASKVKCMKGIFSFDRGKELGSTPKRADVKRNLLFGLVRSVKTCSGYSVWFGLIKQKNN